MKIQMLAIATVGAVALTVLGGAMPAEAIEYLNVVIDIEEYEVTEYNDFNLVRMKLLIENLESTSMPHELLPSFFEIRLGNLDASYGDVTYADVRGKGGDVSVNDCASPDRFYVASGDTAETTACFMIDKSFEPDGLSIESVVARDGNRGLKYAYQVIPFHEESTYCFVVSSDNCNASNIQRVDGTPEPPPPPPPEPEPEPEPATLLYTIYHNQTGVLTLVFNQLVVAHNPDRIHLIHDIGSFIDDGTAPSLDNAELDTADDKRQSPILSFTLSDIMRLEVIQSLRDQADLALWIDTRAIYAADGFVDITTPDNSPILIPDITIVR